MKVKSRALSILLALVMVITYMPVLAFAESESLTDKEKKSSYGFFLWLSENAATASEKEDAEIAAQIISNTLTEASKGKVFNRGNIIGGTHDISYNDLLATLELGGKDDATSLDNLQAAVDYISSGNAYRAKESLPALKVSSALMAMAELNVDYQNINAVFDHSNVFSALENLAYRQIGGTWKYGKVGGTMSDDPYEGWYTKEKENYDNNNGKDTGHYETLTDRQGTMLLTGFGVRDRYVTKQLTASDGKAYDCQMQDRYYSQTFSSKSDMYNVGSGVTPSAYLAYIDEYKIAVHDHDYEVKSSEKATCTEDGSETSVCSICGDTITEVFPATGHTWEKEYTVDKKATCMSEGAESIHCSVCDAIDQATVRTIPMTAHKYGDWKITKKATCTADGSREKICADCGDKVTEVIMAAGHKWKKEYTVDKEATCTAEGSESIHCSVCNAIDKTTAITIQKTEHKYGDWKITKKATCTADGSREKICADCGNKITESIPATGHKWNNDYTTDKKATHSSTGIESIHCSVCNTIKPDSEKTIPVIEHKFGDWQITKEATCSESGNKKRICSDADCGYVEEVTIPATGHKWESNYTVDKVPTCTGEGSESIHCSACDAKKEGSIKTIKATGHSFGAWTTTKKATVDEEGIKEKVCSVCGEKETKTVAKISAQVVAAETLVEAEAAAKVADTAANRTTDLQKAADEAAKTPGDEAIAAANKAKTAAEEAQKAAKVAKEAADKADAAADKAVTNAKNAIEKTAADAAKKKSVKQVETANTAVANADKAVRIANAAVKAAEESKADHIGNPEIKLSASEFTYKYKVEKTGKKKKKVAVPTLQKPEVEAVSLNGKVIDHKNYDIVWSNEESSAMGTYSVTVTLKDSYYGESTAIYTINPKAAKISKPAKGKKKITVKWKKASKNDIKYKALDGYEIQYSLTSDFSSDIKSTTASKKAKSKTIKKLKSKQKYYVRIRRYKKADGGKIYSGWSAVKTVKVK